MDIHKRIVKRIYYIVAKSEGKRQFGRAMRKCEDNIKKNLKGIGWDDMDWFRLTQDRRQWLALLTIPYGPYNAGNLHN
jgi:hypothetical protein